MKIGLKTSLGQERHFYFGSSSYIKLSIISLCFVLFQASCRQKKIFLKRIQKLDKSAQNTKKVKVLTLFLQVRKKTLPSPLITSIFVGLIFVIGRIVGPLEQRRIPHYALQPRRVHQPNPLVCNKSRGKVREMHGKSQRRSFSHCLGE